MQSGGCQQHGVEFPQLQQLIFIYLNGNVHLEISTRYGALFLKNSYVPFEGKQYFFSMGGCIQPVVSVFCGWSFFLKKSFCGWLYCLLFNIHGLICVRPCHRQGKCWLKGSNWTKQKIWGMLHYVQGRADPLHLLFFMHC